MNLYKVAEFAQKMIVRASVKSLYSRLKYLEQRLPTKVRTISLAQILTTL